MQALHKRGAYLERYATLSWLLGRHSRSLAQVSIFPPEPLMPGVEARLRRRVPSGAVFDQIRGEPLYGGGTLVLPRRVTSFGARAAFAAGLVSLAGVVAATLVVRANGASGTPYTPPGDWLPTWRVSIVVSFMAYAAAMLLLAVAGSTGRWKQAFALAVAIQAVPLATPLFLSGDANAYAQIASSPHPYGAGGSVYGPLWTAFSRVIVFVGNPAFVFRLVAFASVIAITTMVSRLSRRKTLATAFVGWNPFIAFHFSSSGHNDALMTALAVGGLTLAAAGRTESAGAAWIASFFVKWTTAPLFLLWAIDRRRRGMGIGFAGAVAATAAILVLSYWLFGWDWLDAFSNLNYTQRQPASFFLAWIREATGISYPHERRLSYIAEIVAFALLALKAWRSKVHLGLAAGILTLIAPHINAWYLILCVSLAAADDDDHWGKVLAVALCGVMFIDVLTGLPD
jgi:hypothetical protein